jgi:hypothetical protein
MGNRKTIATINQQSNYGKTQGNLKAEIRTIIITVPPILVADMSHRPQKYGPIEI